MSCTGLILSLALMGTAGMAIAQVGPFVISTYAGGPSTTPVAAVNAAIQSPQSIATDAAGNVYFTSLSNGSPAYYHGRYGVFKLDRSGILTRIAGNTGDGYSGDGGPAIDAQFRLSNYDGEAGFPGIAVDGGGNVYIADSGNYRVRKVSSVGIITTVAGNGISGNSGDGGPAIGAQLDYPSGLAVDSAGNLYIASGDRVRKVSPDGTITSVVTGFDGAIAVDSAGNLYVAGGGSVLKVLPTGVSTKVASEDGLAMAVDGAGNIYLANIAQVRRITPDGNIATVAGTDVCGYSGDGGPAISARLCVNGLAIDSQGNLYLADPVNLRIRVVSSAGIINTVAGNGNCCYSGDGGPASSALLNLAPWGGGMAVDSGGNLYIADAANQRVRKVSPSGIITTVAGNGAVLQMAIRGTAGRQPAPNSTIRPLSPWTAKAPYISLMLGTWLFAKSPHLLESSARWRRVVDGLWRSTRQIIFTSRTRLASANCPLPVSSRRLPRRNSPYRTVRRLMAQAISISRRPAQRTIASARLTLPESSRRLRAMEALAIREMADPRPAHN